MNNVILRQLNVTATWQPLAENTLVLTVTISAPPTNTAAITLRSADGQQVTLQPGEWHTLQRVNLTDLEVQGTVGNTLSLIGGSW